MDQVHPGITHAMSVDVEDYFHVSVFDGLVPRASWPSMESRVVANTRKLLGIFAEFGIRSTFFVLGWVAERHPELVAEIARAGHEIASHGYAHRLIYDQTPRQFREDVRRAKLVLEDAGGRLVAGYRAPSYSITPKSLWALDVLMEEGYTYDSSVFPIHHDRYGIPLSAREPYVIERQAGSLMEVPAATLRWFGMNLPVSGGGYFRILPYAWTRWSIDRVSRSEHRPVVFYLHPWEIDPDQPRLVAGRLGRFRHYRHLAETEARLRRLIAEFSFDTVGALVDAARRRIPARSLTACLPYLW
jgi:polysaccharide deacetylase family protein (PEP-CTERM system associated)